MVLVAHPDEMARVGIPTRLLHGYNHNNMKTRSRSLLAEIANLQEECSLLREEIVEILRETKALIQELTPMSPQGTRSRLTLVHLGKVHGKRRVDKPSRVSVGNPTPETSD